MLERLGRYEILERIAAGGQGTVYRARDTVLDRVVAIKVINQDLASDPEYLEALQREARMAAGLEHPNITTVYDFQIENDVAYLVMEYIPDSVDRHLGSGRRFPWRRAVEIALQVCRALQHAHQNGVVHRDIKPNNILLRLDEEASVTDFGIARALATSTRSKTTNVMGTSYYMPLEQWDGGSVDGRSDLYSLGMTLFEMITGAPAFQGEAIGAIYVQHREAQLPPIPNNLQVPESIDNLIRHATEKSPEDRFQSAESMSDALEGALTGSSPESMTVGGSAAPPEPPRAPKGSSAPIGPRGPRFSKWLLFGGLAGITALIAIAILVISGDNSSPPTSQDSGVPQQTSTPALTATTLPTKTIAPTYTPFPTYTLAPTYTPLPTSTPRPTPTPRVIIVTATPPPTSECMQVSESNAVTSVGIIPPSYSISFRVTNNCGKSAYAEPTIILFDDENKILTSRTFTGAWIDPGRSQVLTKQISANRGTSVKTFQIEIE